MALIWKVIVNHYQVRSILMTHHGGHQISNYNLPELIFWKLSSYGLIIYLWRALTSTSSAITIVGLSFATLWGFLANSYRIISRIDTAAVPYVSPASVDKSRSGDSFSQLSFQSGGSQNNSRTNTLERQTPKNFPENLQRNSNSTIHEVICSLVFPLVGWVKP